MFMIAHGWQPVGRVFMFLFWQIILSNLYFKEINFQPKFPGNVFFQNSGMTCSETTRNSTIIYPIFSAEHPAFPTHFTKQVTFK